VPSGACVVASLQLRAARLACHRVSARIYTGGWW
jgi:hypothetical protein